MFDDSKRLDKLEAEYAKLVDAHNTVTKGFRERIDRQQNDTGAAEDGLRQRLDAAYKTLDNMQKFDGDLKVAVSKLQQRCTALEAAMKKLK